ncbi:unnamed protein product [Heligmosomoides polygyrus]|uniref:ShTK domain protein n=1 Tax=Heligmosomoides polygyrus TaxID=6339 RepID=A0A183FZP2_HELPZ|nr:unnamed protein product [Heligmosomoides polygyrus]
MMTETKNWWVLSHLSIGYIWSCNGFLCIVSEMLPSCHQLVAVTVLLVCTLAKEDCEKNTREDRCHEIFENIDNCNELARVQNGRDQGFVQFQDCLVTCGKCDAFTCNNPQSDSVLNCTALTSQCNSTVWERMMKEKCPSTCGKCDVKNANLCKDNSDSVVCSAMVQFCNSLDYYDAMTEQCPSTCNRCPANGQNSEFLLFTFAPRMRTIIGP